MRIILAQVAGRGSGCRDALAVDPSSTVDAVEHRWRLLTAADPGMQLILPLE
jgi:hypothetical protein